MDQLIMVQLHKIIKLGFCFTALVVNAQRVPLQQGFLLSGNNTITEGNGLANNILAHYKFDEGAGGAIDSSAGGNTLNEYAGTLASVSGKIGSARQIGNSKVFKIDDTAVFEPQNGNFTFAFWYRYNGDLADGEEKYLISKLTFEEAGLQSYFVSVVHFGTTVGFQFAISEDGSAFNLNYNQLSTGLVIGSWYCVVCRFDPNNGKYMLNVRKEGETEWLEDFDLYGGSISDNASPFVVGGLINGSGVVGDTAPIASVIDELVVWDALLTDCQLDAFYNNGAGLAKTFYNTTACSE